MKDATVGILIGVRAVLTSWLSLWIEDSATEAGGVGTSVTALGLDPLLPFFSPSTTALIFSESRLSVLSPSLSSSFASLSATGVALPSVRLSEDKLRGVSRMIKTLVSPCNFEGSKQVKLKASQMELSITKPDDWHLHLRDGDLLKAVLPHSASNFGRAIVMPNLKPPVTTTGSAMAYRESILKALPDGSNFNPLMTLYLTDTTSPNEIKLAKKSGIVYAVKLYPAGATTNSQDGVTDLFGKCMPALEEMAKENMPLLVHGEVTDPKVDVFDRERIFIETVLQPLIQRLPQLKIVMEHITTSDAVKFVESCREGSVAATVTPQHLLLNRNALFQGGLQPHNYCLPVLKRETHRQAIVAAVTSGSKKFFLGTDSAPHERRRKESSCGCAGIYSAAVALSLYAKVFEEAGALEKLEAFTSFNGPDFYGLPRNSSKITLWKSPWKVPKAFTFSFGEIVPMFAGESLDWEVFSS